MNNQSFAILEYRELLALVRRNAQTPMGRSRVDALTPLADREELHRSLAAVSECITLRSRGITWSFDELSDLAESIAHLRIEGTGVDPWTILELARLCDYALTARAAIRAEREAAPVIWRIVADLPAELSSLVARIRNKILPNGELDDRASPELARIRHEIARARSNITRSLESLMRRSEDAIQDTLVTVRNDRFVIPVRSDHQARVPGVGHGFSSSGATVFVEPLETIEANNELQSLREFELQEIAKILFGLSEELRRQLPAIESAINAVTELDFIGAKVSFAQTFNCTVPMIAGAHSEKGGTLAGSADIPSAAPQPTLNLELIDARHPLLEETLRSTTASVVPVSFSLDQTNTTMIISGANAGGKTVVLKTAGLLSLMALSGLPVPARAATVPFYASVLADIGDHQSLAANLSTFTSHVGNIARMIEICEAPALVLLDEVGTGTDPEEGSALGVAVVDHFRRVCGAHVMATTHYGGLKMYAGNEEGVLNASVEFDEKTLRPTYRLLVGLAGSSSGLGIASRFGIPAQVIDAAATQLSESSRNATEYLRRIKREAEEATALRKALEEERAAVAEKFAALDQQSERRERERQAAFDQALQATVTKFENRAAELVRQIEDRSMRLKTERETQRRMAELRREAKLEGSDARGKQSAAVTSPARSVRVVREGKVVARETTSPERDDENEAIESRSEGGRDGRAVNRDLKVGDRVRLRSFGSIGIVDRIKDDEAEVRVGSLRLREKLENLELTGNASQATATTRADRLRASRGTEFKHAESATAARSELNVIGQTTDEATDAVDKFLDEAFLNSMPQVRIIHGHGTGALRRAIGDLLKSHPHVARFSAAPQNLGGSGATLIELRQ